jgi:hypothetical protein
VFTATGNCHTGYVDCVLTIALAVQFELQASVSFEAGNLCYQPLSFSTWRIQATYSVATQHQRNLSPSALMISGANLDLSHVMTS